MSNILPDSTPEGKSPVLRPTRILGRVSLEMMAQQTRVVASQIVGNSPTKKPVEESPKEDHPTDEHPEGEDLEEENSEGGQFVDEEPEENSKSPNSMRMKKSTRRPPR